MIEEYSVDEVREMQRQAKRKRSGVANKAEVVVGDHLFLTRPQALHIAYEAMKVYLHGIEYTPDWVVILPGGDREYIEVKETRGRHWKGYNIRETKAKMTFLRHVAENFGHRVYLVTVERGRVKTEKEIMP